MANTTIPNLPAATSLDGTEQLELVQNGTSKRVTADQIAALAENTQGTVTQIDTGGALVGGPITTTGTISLPPDAVTNVYLAEMPANTLKANITGLTANPTDVTPSQLLDTFSSAEGAMLYRGVSAWQELAPGSNNQYLYTNGNNPQWVTLAINPGDIGPSGVTPGSYGSASETITFTVISGGLLTTAAAVPIAISNTQVSGLGTMSTQNANNVAITGGNINGTIIGASTPAQASFTTIVSGAWQGTPIDIAYGGTGATTAPNARTNLGLGTMATQNASGVAITGGNINGTAIGNSSPQSGAFTNLSASGNFSVGTITAGTWNGNAIGVAYGGTGATDAATARTNLGAAKSGANSDITSLSGLTTPLSAPQGGTGFSSYTEGDILYATASNALGRLNDVATGNVLLSGGVGLAPAYGKVGLTTHVDGVLPVANGGTGAATLTGYVKGNGTSAMTASATIPNSDLQNSTIQIGSTSIALGASSSTLAGVTTITLTQDPSAALEASTKQYVDNQVSAVSNLTYHTQVTSASTANLNANYSNGTGGVGATLTNAGAFAQFQIDGYTPGSLARVLIKDQTNPAQNGIYEVTTQGDAISVPWVLTRTSDFNAPGSGPNFIQTGASVFVQNGNTLGSTSWVMNTTGTIIVGTTALNWTQSSSSGNILVNAPLSKSGNTISLGTVTVANGGTGLTSYTIGDLLYADSSSSLAALADVATGNVLRSGGIGVAPAWGKVDLSTDVTSTLPVTNGGTGTSTAFTQGSVVFAGASGTYSQNASNFFWDNVNTRLGIHTNTPDATLTVMSETQTALPPGALPAGTDIHVIGANNAETRITQDAFGAGNYPAFTGRHSRGTAASPTATQADDVLSQFTGRGYGTSAYNSASTGILEFAAAENFTNTAQGTYASFRLTATGAAAPAEVLRVGPVGQIGVGGSSYGSAGEILTSGGASAAPSWTSGSSITVGTATNLAGGVSGSLPYQSSVSTTTFLSIGAANTVMTSTGSAPQWVTSLTGLTGVSSSSLTNTSLTSGRVVYSTTGGAQADSANLTFDGTTLSANSATVTTGNLTFSGTGQRITGDMSNATIANRLLFQNSVTNGNTNVAAIANGTGTISVFRGYGASDPTNATAISIAQIGTTESRISSEIFGTASYVPMTFFTGGSERMRLDTSGNLGIGTASPGGKLHAVVTDASTVLKLERTGAGATDFTADFAGANYVQSISAGAAYVWKEGGAEHMRLDASGNLGIGTASPASLLDLTGNDPTLRLTDNAGSPTRTWSIRSSDGNYIVRDVTGSADRFQIGSSGQIGIGGANYGTAGQVLTSNGSGSAPSWQAAGGLPAMTVVTGTTQAASANNHYVLTNAAATTVTLPASPSAGDVVWVTVANGLTTNVIARNGQNINSLAENMTIDNAYAGIQLRFANATKGWVFT